MAKKTKKTGKKKALSPRQIHARVSSLLTGKAFKGKAAEALVETAFRSAADRAGGKPVSFTCSNVGSLVSITSGSIHFVFSGSGGANFPVGANRIFYGVQGPPNQAFSITAQGGTLDFPIADHLTPQGIAGGRRQLTVSA